MSNEVMSIKDLLKDDTSRVLDTEVDASNRLIFKAGMMLLGSEVLGQTFDCYILHSCGINAYYTTDFNSDAVTAPACYSLFDIEDAANAAPDEESVTKQSDFCATCVRNAFGTGKNGRSKACNNGRRLALLPALMRGAKMPADKLAQVKILFCRLPVTSCRLYSKYARQVATEYQMPTFGVMTRISIIPDPKTQFKVTFMAVQPLEDIEIAKLLKTRQEEAKEEIKYKFITDKPVEDTTAF